MCEVLQQSVEEKSDQIRELMNTKEDLESKLFKHSSRLSSLVFEQVEYTEVQPVQEEVVEVSIERSDKEIELETL